MKYKPLSDETIASWEPDRWDTDTSLVVCERDFLQMLEQCRRANACADWMKANLPEMECRGDEECDHCFGLALLAAYLGESTDEEGVDDDAADD